MSQKSVRRVGWPAARPLCAGAKARWGFGGTPHGHPSQSKKREKHHGGAVASHRNSSDPSRPVTRRGRCGRPSTSSPASASSTTCLAEVFRSHFEALGAEVHFDTTPLPTSSPTYRLRSSGRCRLARPRRSGWGSTSTSTRLGCRPRWAPFVESSIVTARSMGGAPVTPRPRSPRRPLTHSLP